jgi:hypothetical protein
MRESLEDHKFGEEYYNHKGTRSEEYDYFLKCLEEIQDYPIFEDCNIEVYPDDEGGCQNCVIETIDGCRMQMYYLDRGENNQYFEICIWNYPKDDEHMICHDWNKVKSVLANAKATKDIVISD